MIGSTTENLADILKVQYLKVRKNNKNYNFVLIQMNRGGGTGEAAASPDFRG